MDGDECSGHETQKDRVNRSLGRFSKAPPCETEASGAGKPETFWYAGSRAVGNLSGDSPPVPVFSTHT